jgi:ubiquinone/menaquinone biosynthesis C-methylase UbiE
VLDVASASGEPATTVAKVLPQARVVSTDLEEGYLVLGQAHAAHAGVEDRVTFETADGEDLHRYPRGTFDALTCSFGACLA